MFIVIVRIFCVDGRTIFRVRVVAMTGLVIVHTLCRWPVNHSVASTTRAAGYITR